MYFNYHGSALSKQNVQYAECSEPAGWETQYQRAPLGGRRPRRLPRRFVQTTGNASEACLPLSPTSLVKFPVFCAARYTECHCLVVCRSGRRERRNLHSEPSRGGRGNCKDKVPAAESLRSPQPPPLIRDLSVPTSTERSLTRRERERDRCGSALFVLEGRYLSRCPPLGETLNELQPRRFLPAAHILNLSSAESFFQDVCPRAGFFSLRGKHLVFLQPLLPPHSNNFISTIFDRFHGVKRHTMLDSRFCSVRRPVNVAQPKAMKYCQGFNNGDNGKKYLSVKVGMGQFTSIKLYFKSRITVIF